jgi:hypothetical protein
MNCILGDRVESFDPEAASRRRGEAKRAPCEFRELGLSCEVVAGPAFHPAWLGRDAPWRLVAFGAVTKSDQCSEEAPSATRTRSRHRNVGIAAG